MQIISSARILGGFYYSDEIWHLAPKVGNPTSISWISIKVVQFADTCVASFGVMVTVMDF